MVDEFALDAPKTKLLAQKVKAMGFDEVLVITDEVDENLHALRRATCTNVDVMLGAPRQPGGAGALQERAAHQGGAWRKLEEMLK